MMRWTVAWFRSPRRMWLIWIVGICPDCRKPLAWGQWNDGDWAGWPFCFTKGCSR